MSTVEAITSHIEAVDSIEIEVSEDGIDLHLVRHDGSGVLIEGLSNETYTALKKTFLEVDGKAEDCAKCREVENPEEDGDDEGDER